MKASILFEILTCSGKLFQTVGPVCVKALSPHVFKLVLGLKRILNISDLRERVGLQGTISSDR